MTTPCCPSHQYEVSQAELDLYKGKFTSGEEQLKEAKERQAAIRKETQDKKKQVANTEQSLPLKRKELAQCEAEMKVSIVSPAPLRGGGVSLPQGACIASIPCPPERRGHISVSPAPQRGGGTYLYPLPPSTRTWAWNVWHFKTRGCGS